MNTEKLLEETVDSACIREEKAIDELLGNTNGRVVLFGAGRIGRKVVAALRQGGIEPLAFADNDPQLIGALVDGIQVLAPALAAQRWGRDALFVITTFLPTGGGMGDREVELSRLGCKRITSFLQVGWKFEGILPHFAADRPSGLLRHAPELAKVGRLWTDDLSRETYRKALYWRLHARFDAASQPVPDQYFPRDLLRPNSNEIFVDGGAYDGDTLRAAPWPLSKVLAIEPDPTNAARLRAAMRQNTQLHEVLLGSSSGFARFSGNGTMASSRSDIGTLEIPVATLDDLTKEEHPTFVKLDVEGDELVALKGGLGMLKREKPVVAVCVYHRPEDLWRIPTFLDESLPDHAFYLRAHAWDGFELVFYAVPRARCLVPK